MILLQLLNALQAGHVHLLLHEGGSLHNLVVLEGLEYVLQVCSGGSWTRSLWQQLLSAGQGVRIEWGGREHGGGLSQG